MDRYAWRDLGTRPLFFPSLSLLLGALWAPRTDASAELFLVCGVFLGLFGLALARLPGAHLAVLGALGLAGVGLARWEARTEVPLVLTRGGDAVVEGEVERVDPLEGATRVRLAVARAGPGDAALERARFKVNLTLRGSSPPPLLPGQRLRTTARLTPHAPAANPGEKDFSSVRWRQGVAFLATADAEAVLVLSRAPGWRWEVEDTRERLAEATHRLAPSRDAAALFLTLAAGRRAELDAAWEEAFSKAGLAHVLSVSGLHVAALALMTLALLRRLLVRVGERWRKVDARRVAAPAAVPFVWAYVLFTGSQPPAVRSAVMATVVLLGLSWWKRADGLNGLAAAALVLGMWAPSSVEDLSLRLSFLAVLGLVLLVPALRLALPLSPPAPGEQRRWVRLWGKARESVAQTLCASAAATLAGLPVVAWAFGRVSLAGLVSNVVALPLCGLLTGVAAGGAALFVVAPPLATPVLWVGAWASELLLWLTRVFAAMPWASVEVASLGGWSALYALGLLSWALGTGRWRLGGWLAPLALVASVFVPRLMPQPGLRVTFLSVGQGDAVVLSSDGHHALVDGGGAPGGADTGTRFVLPYLRHQGISRLDLAVLSHPHPDHALGLVSALGSIPTARLWLPAGDEGGPLSRRVVAAARDAHVEEVEAGHPPLTLGEATLEVLGPPEAAERELLEGVNDRSVVLRVRHGDVTVLLPGDVEHAAEEQLAETVGPVTVMKAPHHGSRTSSTQALLERARPRYVVFCVGRRNRFGFPHPDVEARYRALGSECWRTDIDGAVTVESDGRDVRLLPHLTREPPLGEPRLADDGRHSHR
ncbi:DNA internalization-related competence protein ComEC/Rec2 [Myxococcus stipitatus DSM 14675]|uniref:DNA internalization-related competence protein ComEC/Rec2 n=1 Tax=Myxococcus stipitatus (strain DSM 14675 / JCM 12634 / Mx s8) TaxID=1278073 RepID=L7UCZ3_MYXSD|nr:DNA internalization-related competence protein ComEC/Rec2 [Myxococcus stipitatus]AGC44334.1 DNA internalization-related competence protein ComEC/Rec2 [Myxococcus stipitatus DSM 14675]